MIIYNYSIIQTEPVGSIVYTVLASDPDYSSGGNFHFVLIDPVCIILCTVLYSIVL